MASFEITDEGCATWSGCVVGPGADDFKCLKGMEVYEAARKLHESDRTRSSMHVKNHIAFMMVGTERGEAACNAWNPDFKGEVVLFSSVDVMTFTVENVRELLAEMATKTAQ